MGSFDALGFDEVVWELVFTMLASRRYEDVCVLLRRIQMDGSIEDQQLYDLLDVFQERLLECPSTNDVCHDPSVLHDWIHTNRAIRADLPSECDNHIIDLFNLICFGNYTHYPQATMLSWQIKTASELFICTEWLDIDDIHGILRKYHENFASEDAIVTLTFNLLFFQFTDFIDNLVSFCQEDSSFLWFAAHLSQLVPQKPLNEFMVKYGQAIFEADQSLWRISADYLLEVRNPSKRELEQPVSVLLRKVFLESTIDLPVAELIEFCEDNDLSTTLQVCLKEISLRLLKQNQRRDALLLSSQSPDIILFNKILILFFQELSGQDFLNLCNCYRNNSTLYVPGSLLHTLIAFCEFEVSGFDSPRTLDLFLQLATNIDSLPSSAASRIIDRTRPLLEKIPSNDPISLHPLLCVLKWLESASLIDQGELQSLRKHVINKVLN